MRLIATWTTDQNPETDDPASLRWEDGSPATMDDFRRIDTSSQTGPDEYYSAARGRNVVECGYVTA